MPAFGGARPDQRQQSRSEMAVTCPHLLAIDYHLVAFNDAPGAQRGEVATGLGLRKRLSPRLFAREKARQIGRGDVRREMQHRGTDDLDGQVGVGDLDARAAQFVVVGRTVAWAATEPA